MVMSKGDYISSWRL